MRRIVIDTSVIASALRSRSGASHAILDLVGARRLVPLATPALFLQYEAVLKRPEQLAVSLFTPAEIDRLLAALASLIEPVVVHYAWRPQLPDPDDEMVFDAAVNGRADALVTHNVRDFDKAAPRFGLRVARPAEVLREVLR
jgi:putative PIN family toxin of toxin-antitoxin system